MAAKASELGVPIMRMAYGWDQIEPLCKGCFDWSKTDAWRDAAKQFNLSIYGSLAYVPGWANGGQEVNYPPQRYSDWYDFVFAVVSRYRDDIFLWGIWNEPNLEKYLHGTDVNVYRELVATGFSAIRAANPRAIVLGPEVSQHAMQSGWFASAMTASGALFDAVSVHWYPGDPKLDTMMDDFVRPYALGKEIWLTETGKRPCESIYGEVGQALFYHDVLDAFQARRPWWGGVIFYDLNEAESSSDCGNAITRPDWSNRPAFDILQQEIRKNP